MRELKAERPTPNVQRSMSKAKQKRTERNASRVWLQGDAARLTSAVIVRLFCIYGALLSVFAGAAFGEGTYQRTKDGKTIVWNNDPKPGDAATWFGDRDGEGYATKVGTLTWYTANGAVYARYFGNMVRGKFDGMVNVHSKGKTDHAIFVDGQRTTRWAAGPAPSWRVAQSRARRTAKPAAAAEAPAEGPPTVREAENAQRLSEPERSPSRRPTPNAKSFRGQAAQRPIEDTPAKELSEQRAPPAKPAATAEPASAGASAVAEPEGPAEGPPTVREAENAQRLSEPERSPSRRPAPNSESFREQAAQPPIEATPTKELSEQRAPPAEPAVTAEPASAGPPGVAEPEAPAEGPRVVQAESAQPATPSSESFREQTAQPTMEDTPSVLIEPSKESVPTPPTSKKSQAEVEDSLQSLVRPPSSLLAIPETAGSPEASPRLTKEEVINIANAEARTHGYNRADYQRAEPQYNADYKIWSVSYEQSATDGMEEAGNHFSVIVDDKTKGRVFVPRR